MVTRMSVSVALFLALCVLPLAAQNLTPEETVRALLKATNDEDWTAAAQLMHPEALGQFKMALRDPVASDSTGQLGDQLFGIQTVGAYDKTRPDELYWRFLSHVYAMSPNLKDVMSKATFQVLGSVSEGQDLAHVLYRIRLEVQGTEIRRMAVQDVQRYDGQWKALLGSDISEMILKLKNIGK